VIALTFFTHHRRLPLLYHLRFDFNPLNLRTQAEIGPGHCWT